MLKINRWWVDPDTCRLIPEEGEAGEEIKITPRSMDVLVYLAERPGQVVSPEELLDQFWVSASATDHAVHKVIAALRSALGDEAGQPRYIKTLPKRGYALIAEVERQEEDRTGGRERPVTWPGRLLRGNRRRQAIAAAAGAMALVVAAGGLFQLLYAQRETGAVSSIPAIDDSPQRLAILEPDLSALATSTQGQQVEALVDSLGVSLSRLSDLNILSGTESLAAAEQAGAEFALHSTMHVLGDELRLAMNLVRVENEVSLYANQFSLQPQNLPAIENEVVPTVVQSLSIHLDEERRREMQAWGTSNPQAYNHFLQARFYNEQYNHKDWKRALEHYEKAIQEDPGFINAYLGKAKTANNMAVYSRDDRVDELSSEVLDLSRRLALVAPESSALETLKSIRVRIEGRNEWQLEREYRQQIREGDAPGYVYARYALYLIGARLYAEANDFLDMASRSASHRISPNEAWNFRTQTLPPEELAEVKVEQLRDRPVHIGILGTAISSLAYNDEIEKANEYLERQSQYDGDGVRAHLSRVILAVLTDEVESQRYGDLYDPELLNDPDLAFNNGVLYFMQGEFQKGAEYWRDLTRIDRRKLYTRLHHIEIFFPDSLRRDPRYAALLEDLDVGRGWQQRLMAGVVELSEYIDVQLAGPSRDYYQSDELMLRNNLWGLGAPES